MVHLSTGYRWVVHIKLLYDLLRCLHRERYRSDQRHAGGPAEAVAETDQGLGGRLAAEDLATQTASEPRGVGEGGAVVGPEAFPVHRGPGQAAGDPALPGLIHG